MERNSMALSIDEFVLDVFENETYLIVQKQNDFVFNKNDEIVFRNRKMIVQSVKHANDRLGLKLIEAPLV